MNRWKAFGTDQGILVKHSLRIYGLLSVLIFQPFTPARADIFWTKIPTPSTPLSFPDASGAAVVGGTIYVENGGPIGIYDTNTRTWSSGASVPTIGSDMGVVAIGGTVYAIGGIYCCPGSFISKVEAYDTATNTWSVCANLNKARWVFAAVAVGGTLYAIGGVSSASNEASMEAYDPNTNTWVYKASMPFPRICHAAATIGTKIYVVGGWGGGGPLASLQVYDTATNSWTTKAPMSIARSALAAAVVGGTLYAMGGTREGSSDASGRVSLVEAYDPNTNSWVAQSSLIVPRFWFSAVSVGSTLYALGGHSIDATQFNEAGLPASSLPSQVNFDPRPASVGQWITVSFTVTNTSTDDISIQDLRAVDESYPHLVFPVDGPIPAIPRVISAGNAETFKWTMSLSGSGTLHIVANASGMSVPTGDLYGATASAAMAIYDAAQLFSGISFSPDPAPCGTVLRVSFTVWNLGGTSATVYAPSIQNNSNASWIAPLTFPSVITPFVLSAGSSTIFEWTYSVTGGGILDITATETGTYIATGTPLLTSSSGNVTLIAPAQLQALMTLLPPNPAVGDNFKVNFTVKNIGTVPATDLLAGLSFTGTGGIELVSTPTTYLASLAGGKSEVYSWTFSAKGLGTVLFTGSVSATSSFDGSILGAGDASTLTIKPAVIVYMGPVRVFPNPFTRSKAVRGNVKFEGVPLGNTLHIYDPSGISVWKGKSSAAVLEWDGRNGAGKPVAPGVYLWMVEGGKGRDRGKIIVE